MLPTRLNLLSSQKQDHLHKMVYIQYVKHLLELVLFFVAIMAIALVGTDTMLHNYFSSITNRVDVSVERISRLNQDVQYINSTVNRVYFIQEKNKSWPERVNEISAAIPEGISLTSFSLDDKVYVFRGTATTRDALLSYQTELESLPYIASVSFPISQLTKKEDITFSMTADLK